MMIYAFGLEYSISLLGGVDLWLQCSTLKSIEVK